MTVALVALATTLILFSPSWSAASPSMETVMDGPPDSELIGVDDFDGDAIDDHLYAISDGNSINPIPRIQIESGVNASLLATISGAAVGDEFAASVQMFWDVNDDGDNDLMIGAPEAGINGKAYLFHGPFVEDPGPLGISTTDAAITLNCPDAAYYQFGMQVAIISDIDGGGIPEIGVRARLDLTAYNMVLDIFKTYIFDGASGQQLVTLTNCDDSSFWATNRQALADRLRCAYTLGN